MGLVGGRLWSVFVVVTLMGGVAVSVVEIVDMPIVRHCFVPAVGTVFMGVGGVLDVGEGVLVVVTFVLAVGVSIVDVVGVTIMVDCGVSAARTMDVAVLVVDGVVGRRQGVSFAWLTASATMWATC